ncbi:hypothetical protein PLEOSDRAFT_155037 [Pleurotus ostreatus PC15]|uniref:Uncharacterized protein n=1 Tax=Pleurotus ostreatus (strain PC15) TaxID=1137138 RepID=A0A067P3D1_PLEO1|nr:hypothetical protein PLEOSDRAFT_155037 [Pleurotus ostreatus PC15]
MSASSTLFFTRQPTTDNRQPSIKETSSPFFHPIPSHPTQPTQPTQPVLYHIIYGAPPPAADATRHT